jgi:outer membrane receptor protein involved in Fe transport
MALQRYDAGFLDNPVTGENGVNDFRTRGLRGSIVFTPTDGTKITYLSTYQDTKLYDQTYLTSVSDLTRAAQRKEPQETSFFLNSLRLDQQIGDFANFTMFGSVDKKTNQTLFSDPYGYVTGVTTGPDTAYDITNAHANIKQVEARLASAGDGPFRWLIGTSYMRATKYSYDQLWEPGAEAIVGSVLAPNDRIYGYLTNSLNEDFGVFGEVSWKPVPALELTAGGRYYNTRAKASILNQASFLAGSATDITSEIDQKEDGFTPKATIALRPTRDFMFYMTYSQGYRVGGANPNAGLLPGIQPAYSSDTVDNYEAGTKFGLFGNRVLIDASVFTIDWKDIQARLFGPAPSYFSYVSNAGSANITGVEFSGSVKLTRNLGFSSNATYEDAKLTSVLPTSADGTGYASGTPLPGASRWTVANNLTLDYPEMTAAPTFEIAHRYISKAPVAFGNDNTRGGFSQFDARASITVMQAVRLLAFANNVFDKRGILNAPFTAQTAPAYSVTRPRTIGLRVDVGF